jgi:hypothetical protein
MKRKTSLRTLAKNYAEEGLILAGFLLVLIGAYQLNAISAWFVGGAECLLYAFLLAWSKRK